MKKKTTGEWEEEALEEFEEMNNKACGEYKKKIREIDEEK